jgi:hypothetical protein
MYTVLKASDTVACRGNLTMRSMRQNAADRNSDLQMPAVGILDTHRVRKLSAARSAEVFLPVKIKTWCVACFLIEV